VIWDDFTVRTKDGAAIATTKSFENLRSIKRGEKRREEKKKKKANFKAPVFMVFLQRIATDAIASLVDHHFLRRWLPSHSLEYKPTFFVRTSNES
jgi:hypothetical protein